MWLYSIYSDIPFPNYTIDRATIPTTTMLVERRDGAMRPIRCLLKPICSSVPARPDMCEGKRSRSRSRRLVARYGHELLHRRRYELEGGTRKSRSQAFSQIATRLRSARQQHICHAVTMAQPSKGKARNQGPSPHLSDRARSIPPHVIVQLF